MKKRVTGPTTAQRLRNQLRSATRGALLDAAEAVFAERGIGGARVEDIAARAGVAVGTLYNYFAESSELLDALVVERGKDLIARVDQAVGAAGGVPWAAQVERFIRATLDSVRDHAPFYAVLLQCENRKAHRSDPDVGAAFYARARTLVRRGVRVGAVPAADAAVLPAILVALCRAPLVHLRHAPSGASQTRELTDQLVRFFWAALDGRTRH